MFGKRHPNRREVAVGMAAAGAAATEARAEAREQFRLTAEQIRIRHEGIQRMRASATTSNTEIAQVFIARPNGVAEWIDVPMIQTGARVGSNNDSMQLINGTIDHRVLDRTIRLAEDGAHVEHFHTHPTALGDSRIPPSPRDLLSSLELSRRTRDARGTLSQSAVSETGVYAYGPTSTESGELLLSSIESAVRSTADELRQNRDGGRALATIIERGLRDAGQPAPTELISAFRNGRIADAILLNPSATLAIAALEPVIAVQLSEGSPQAREFMQSIQRGRDALIAQLRVIDPETDGDIHLPPMIGDYTRYTDRWRKLGMKIEFTPHPAQ